MIGAIIGDLAAWTWENEHEKFYPYLVAENAQKSRYSDVILFASDTLLNNPSISREEFQRLYLCYFGYKDPSISLFQRQSSWLPAIKILYLYGIQGKYGATPIIGNMENIFKNDNLL